MAGTANSIITPQTPWSGAATVSAANTNFSTPTNLQVLLDEADNVNGARIDAVWAVNQGTLSAVNNLQLYAYDGASTWLIDSEGTTSSNTPSASTPNNKTLFDYSDTSPLTLKAGVGLKVGTGAAITGGMVFFAQGGLY